MSSYATDSQLRLEQLEKENRILQKKLERANADCFELEETARKKESLLRQVIHELRESQTNLEKQSCELAQAITDLKQTQAQLIQTEKMSSLGQLVAGVAHEINNPVNFIYGNLNHLQGYSQNLMQLLHCYQQYYPQPVAEIEAEADLMDLAFIQEDLPNLLNSMHIGVERIREIVLSLRNFSRLDESDFKAVDIHEGIDSTLLILQHRLKENAQRDSIRLVKHYCDLPLVACYPGQLNQVFMNILSNAIDALEEAMVNPSIESVQADAPEITITTTVVESQWVEVAIADNGPGIPEAVQTHIFDLFFTTKPIGQGTGIGMSISYQIITEKHGGKLTFTSKPGQGTTFFIQIPIRQTPLDPV